MIVEGAEVQDRYYSGMLDSRYGLGFGKESNESVRILAELPGQELHRNRTVETVVVGEPDLGHTSLPEPLAQLIPIIYDDAWSHLQLLPVIASRKTRPREPASRRANKGECGIASTFMTGSRRHPLPGRSSGLSVSVCLPALNVESTIAAICESISGSLMPGMVDELIVIDSGSRDATPATAAAAGAEVYRVDDIAPRIDAGGKGEALWKSVAVARGDIIVWLDSDIHNFTPEFVARLLNPLLAFPELVMTKAYYRRPLQLDATTHDDGGGRVTEIALRPLINLLCPELAAIIQPLSGEYAIRRQVALDLPFFSGYGVDIGLLVDVVHEHGLSTVRQVDLGTRVHTNRSVPALGRTSFEVMTAFLTRMAEHGRLSLEAPLGTAMRQFDASNQPSVAHSDVIQLPPWRSTRGGFVGTQMTAPRLATAPH